MGVTSVFHIGFCVRDIDASIRFYQDGLGLVLRHRQVQDNPYTRSLVGYSDAVLHIAQFQLADQEPPPSGHVLELIQYVQPVGASADPERNRLGAGHLAFTVNAIEPILRRLIDMGARPINEPVEITAGINKGGRSVYLFDPDGVNLELLELPKQSHELSSTH
jgi:catechol 2,3-dioxygenase-like lactoylglutathione lyase family enzyme